MTEETTHKGTDPRILQWLVVQALHDRDARLVDGGAQEQDRIDLSHVFVDLPVCSASRASRGEPQEGLALTTLLQSLSSCDEKASQVLLVGGPGSGKSTVTTMLAQVLRLGWLRPEGLALPEALANMWVRTRKNLEDLTREQGWSPPEGLFPVRVSLPSLARWMASRPGPPSPSLWDYLAWRLSEDLAAHELASGLAAESLAQGLTELGSLLWILDGLDEVPRSAGRAAVLGVVRATAYAPTATSAGLVVATRPQGYEGEFDELGTMTLQPLPEDLALKYGERLVSAWCRLSASSDTSSKLGSLRVEFAKPEVTVLLQTPLHTTIAALLVAAEGTLPKSRYQLFEDYFTTVVERERKKRIEHGMDRQDEELLRDLHERAGLLLHTRAQAQSEARASLRRKELRALLETLYAGQGYKGEELQVRVDRVLRFAAERLVLLIHDVEGEFSFGVRSLQEFFAADALVSPSEDIALAMQRMDAVVRSSHWDNVVAFVVSRCALATKPQEQHRALQVTAERCRALNEGKGGEAAARCWLGSHLALAMLEEAEGYAGPWLREELWAVALQAAREPSQDSATRFLQRERFRHPQHIAWWGEEEIHVRLGHVAARRSGESGNTRRSQILHAAKDLFAQGEEQETIAWRLLQGLLCVEDRAAEDLATQHAPTTESAAKSAFDAGGTTSDGTIPAWWCRYLDAHIKWFTPAVLRGRYWGGGNRAPALAPSIIDALRALPRVSLRSRICYATLTGISIEAFDLQIPTAIAEASPIWGGWSAAVAFLKSPSHLSLADILDICSIPDVLLELSRFISLLPWPLASSLSFLQLGADATELASRVRSRTLGGIEEWGTAEARWSSGRAGSLMELDDLLSAVNPWPAGIETRGLPLSPRTGFELLSPEAEMHCLRWFDAHPELSVRAIQVVMNSGLFRRLPLRLHHLLDSLPSHRLSHRFQLSLLPATHFEGRERDGWFDLLNARGRQGIHSVLIADLPEYRDSALALLRRYRDTPDNWGLLDALMPLTGALSYLARDESPLPAPPNDAHPRARAQHALLTLCTTRFREVEIPPLLEALRWNDDAPRDLRFVLAFGLGARVDDSHAVDVLLAILDGTPVPDPRVRDALLGALYAQARHPGKLAFFTREDWEHHALPEPFLPAKRTPQRAPVLRSLDRLENVKLFAETPPVDQPFPVPSGDQGQWIVLVGQNGVGKTTLLRCLALALASPAVTSKLLDERLPLMRNGQEARITVTFERGRSEIALRREGRTETVHALAQPEGDPPWVVAYGVRRGNALGEKDRAAEPGAVGELHTLFERPAALHSATQWLRDLDAEVLRERSRNPRREGSKPGPRELLWDSVEHALRTILRVDRITVEEGGVVLVHHAGQRRVPFEAMSDGYLSTAGWLVDMLARWVSRQQELDEPLGPNFHLRMCGMVLLDEIDLHLHPTWQLRIIEDVRKLFPRMSFVVTTHNPLALHGARAGEIYVVREEKGKIELVQRDIRPGQDIDRVLLEQFGIEHTLDEATRKLLADHRELVERGVSPEDPERRRLEVQLVDRFGDAGATLGEERYAEDSSPLRPEEQHLLDAFPKKK